MGIATQNMTESQKKNKKNQLYNYAKHSKKFIFRYEKYNI